jgi:molybdopterin-guanine dinucleotide biosynthesis protein A
MRILAVIVAGGRSSRMGREKAFELIGGRTIMSRIVERLSGQVSAVVINANGNVERFRDLGLPVIGDVREDVGTPLAGLHAALCFANEQDFASVLTVPSDCPFLPLDLAGRLAAEGGDAAIAASGGQAHYLTGLWSRHLLEDLEQALDQPPRLQDWARRCGAAVVEWPAVPFDPFFNVNTPEELAEAEQIAAKFRA